MALSPSEIQTIDRLRQQWESQGKADELKDFATSFNDTVLPELQAAVDQCGGQEEFVPALTEYLKGEGVSDDALQWVGPVIGVMLEMRNSTLDSDHKTSL